MTDAHLTGATLALALADDDDGGVELLLALETDWGPVAWWLATVLLAVLPDRTAGLRILADLDADADPTARDRGLEVCRSILTDDPTATRKLLPTIDAAAARWLAHALVVVLDARGADPAAHLREFLAFRSTVEAIDRDIARTLGELPPAVAQHIAAMFKYRENDE
jgi:hypothetical protein